MRYSASGLTDIGKIRKENQDHFFILEEEQVYGVADGMGGHAGGNQASSIAVETIKEQLKGIPVTKEAVDKALKIANERILAVAEKEHLNGMGTTIVLAFYDEIKALWYVAHIGDSRLYMLDIEGKLSQITSDHSLVHELVVRGELTEEAARVHPQKNILTRALGMEEGPLTEWDDIKAVEVQSLLLCSDGLYNMVDEGRISDILMSEGDVFNKAENLVNQANSNGGADNITVVLISAQEVTEKC